MKNITLILTGSVAAVRYERLINAIGLKYNLTLMYTDSSKKFLNEYEMLQNENIKTVYNNSFSIEDIKKIDHINLHKETDLIIVAPASYNFINSYANGIATNFILSFMAAADPKKIVFAPAMNTNMYNNKIYQKNVKYLAEIGVKFIEPISGMLACKDIGIGMMEKINKIMLYIDNLFDFKNKRSVVVAIGSTKSYIDPVRFITNGSSGKMGLNIANEFYKKNYDVTIVCSKEISLNNETDYMNVIRFETNEQLKEELVKLENKCEILIMSCAPTDFEFNKSESKMKKDDFNFDYKISNDIVKDLNFKIKFGFALESENHVINGKKKLESKNLDYILVNDIKTINSDEAFDVKILTRNESINFDKCSKKEMAKNIVELLQV